MSSPDSRAKFEVLGRVSLGEPSFATPAVADGVMYLRTSSHLFSWGGPVVRVGQDSPGRIHDQHENTAGGIWK